MKRGRVLFLLRGRGKRLEKDKGGEEGGEAAVRVKIRIKVLTIKIHRPMWTIFLDKICMICQL